MELRIDPDLYERFNHFAEVQGESRNQLMQDAMEWYMKYVYQDYDLPTAEVTRLNQLIDSIENMRESVGQMRNTMQNGFRSVLGVMRGSSYLESDEIHDDNRK